MSDKYEDPQEKFLSTGLYVEYRSQFAEAAIKTEPELTALLKRTWEAGADKDGLMKVAEKAGATPALLTLIEAYIDEYLME